MKKVDYNKPIRFTEGSRAVHYVGIDSSGMHVVQIANTPEFARFNDVGQSVDRYYQDLENVPEKIARWICVMPDSGFPTKEEAAKIAALDHRYSVVQVEFEEGQRP
jgi:hypothetical protein